VEEAKQMITPQATVAGIESTACILTILLIVALRAYRKYVHRLTLYLAIVNLALSASVGLGILTVDTGKASKKSVDVMYLDFKKALDSVPHEQLLFTLRQVGIIGPLWKWFR